MHKPISTRRRRLRTLAALATSVVAGGLVTAVAAAPAGAGGARLGPGRHPPAGGSSQRGRSGERYLVQRRL